MKPMTRTQLYLFTASILFALSSLPLWVDFTPDAVVAAEPMATPAPPDPPGECDEWMKAGTSLVYFCENTYNGDRCYIMGNMMFCLSG